MISGYLGGLPAFLAYFGTAMALLALFAAVFVAITAHREFALIRAGNLAAVAAFLGTATGFALPMTTAMRFGANWFDFVIWAVIAALIQIAAYYVARALMPDVTDRITRGDVVGGVWLGGVALLFGVVNAASMTPPT